MNKKEIEQKIAERRKEALKKDFYGLGQRIVEKRGKNNIYDDQTIRIVREDSSQEFTGGSNDIEIFFNGTSVYRGDGNAHAGPSESDIQRYVPGEWEENLKKILKKEKNKDDTSVKPRKSSLLKNWGIQ